MRASPRELREENDRLRKELEAIRGDQGKDPSLQYSTMPGFTVGLAASEGDFDSPAFEKLLEESLQAAAKGGLARVIRETDERQISKVHGMLVQQYLASEEVPITIRNLSYKIQDKLHDFKIGNQIVPRSGLRFSQSSAGSTVARHPGPVPAVMRRDSRGQYSISFEELGGGRGNMRIQATDIDILTTDQKPRSERQGDISFNWNLNLKQIRVYRIENFQGDVGSFLSHMRYSGVQSSIAQYQTVRDVAFLFGYGSYRTSVVNQIRTPAHITSVEVLAIGSTGFDKLEGRLSEEEILEIVGEAGQWIACEYVNFSGSEKIWTRPATVQFPFISRQRSAENKRVFYLKYDGNAVFFIGEYEQ
ncbi:MAG: hypothetical protein ACE5F1_04560 [Planctomycetota bacterium]